LQNHGTPSDIGFLITTAGTRATSLVDKMHNCKIMERERVSPMNSAFSLAMAATSATSIAEKMHFCKIMEQSVFRYRIDVLFDDGCNKCDIFS
jgi:hypothetical protein